MITSSPYFWFFAYLGIFARYLLIAGISFLVFYVFFKKRWSKAKIQERFPKKKDYWREVVYSLSSVAIFATTAWLLIAGPLKEYTQIYWEIGERSWAYYGLSMVLMFFLHDTWFYWTHRLMHHPKLFKITHLVHHKSVNPSPWASYAFHPTEGVVEAGILVLIAFVIPVHITALSIFFFLSIIYNVYGHLGYEIYPKGTNKHWLGQWLNTSTNHNMHHRFGHGNYGLYFTFWDKVMGTTHPKYHETFEQIAVRKANNNQKQISPV